MPFYPLAVLQNYGIGNKYHNAFRSIHFASQMPKYSNFRKDYARMASYRKPVPGGTGTANALAIRSLERKVAGLKPETQYLILTTSFSGLSRDSFEVCQWSPTVDLAGAADRSDRVLGDSWKNKFIEVRCGAIAGDEGLPGPVRFVVYKPHKAATTITPTSFISHFDPSQCTVLHDEIIKPYAVMNENSSTGVTQAINSWVRKINLNNMKSTYIGTTAEEGAVRCCIMISGLEATATPSYGFAVSTKHAYSNK